MANPVSWLWSGTAVVTCLVLLAGCGGADGARPDDGRPVVVTSFYPLEFLVQRVGGQDVQLSTLTAPGADPHTLELSPAAVRSITRADLVLYSGGLQVAVDEAVASAGDASAVDLARVAGLQVTGDQAGAVDPHWWLDPQRYLVATEQVADELTRLDPDRAAVYHQRAAGLVAELDELAADYRAGLADCEQQVVVTSHEAFGYLTETHGLTQVGISGLTPEADPSPARMARITRVVRTHEVDTVYSEVILGSALAETIATETGARVLVLDPVESLTEASPGEDYLEVMRSNLQALRTGQDCG